MRSEGSNLKVNVICYRRCGLGLYFLAVVDKS